MSASTWLPLSSVEQAAQEIAGQLRHVAGDDQVPIGGGSSQGSQNSAEGAFARVEIGDRVLLEFPTRVTLPAAARTVAATDCARVAPWKGSKALSRPMRELFPPTSTYPARLLTRK